MPRKAVDHYYLVTIKCSNVKFTSSSDILKVYRRTVSRSQCDGPNYDWSDQIAWELDSLNRLHLHTIVKTNKSVNVRNFCKTNWSVHFQPFPLEDYKKVQDYITKHRQSPDALDDIEAISFCQYHIVNTDYFK